MAGSWPAVPAALAVLLLAVLIRDIAALAYNVPIQDEWDINGNLLAALEEHRVNWAFLFSQHNEHRMLTMRVLLLALLPLTRWNVYPLIMINVATAVLTAVVLWMAYIRCCALAQARSNRWVLPLIAMLVLAPSQMENWLFGDQWVLFVCNLFAISGLLLLAMRGDSRVHAVSAAALGLLATLTDVQGLLFWPVAVAIVAARATSGRRIIESRPWAALGALAWIVYMYDFFSPPWHPSPLYAARHPLELLHFGLVFIGNPIAGAIWFDSPEGQLTVPAAGVVYLLLLAMALWVAVRSSSNWHALLPWIGLGGFYALTAASVAIGRLGFGVGMAASPRYITLSYPLWVVLLVIADLGTTSRSAPDASLAARMPRRIFMAVLGAAIVIGLLSLNTHYQRWKPTPLARAESALELPDVCVGNRQLIERLYPSAERVAALLPLFQRYHISFTEQLPLQDYRLVPEPLIGVVTAVEREPSIGPSAGGCWRVEGKIEASGANAVVLAADGRVVKRALVHPNAGQPGGHWTLHLVADRLARGNSVELYAQMADGATLRPLKGADIKLP